MKIHIVQKGDTLWKIAKKYGVNFEELKKMNSQLSNPDMIMPGMKIKVPTSGGSVKKEAPLNMGAKKEAPVKEQPIQKVKEEPIMEAPKVEAPKVEAPKVEAPKAEVPKKTYVPKMPKPIIPEIDINNYYLMNMANINVPKEQEKVKPIQEAKPVPQPKPIKEVKPVQEIKPVQEVKPVQQAKPIQQPQLPPKPTNILPKSVEPEMDGPFVEPSSLKPIKGGNQQSMYPYFPNQMQGFAPGVGGPTPQVQGAGSMPMYNNGMPGVEGNGYMPMNYGDEESSAFIPPNVSPMMEDANMAPMSNMPNMPNMEQPYMAPAMQPAYPCPPYPAHLYPVSPVLPGPGPVPYYGQPMNGYPPYPQVQGAQYPYAGPNMQGNYPYQMPMPAQQLNPSVQGASKPCGCGGSTLMGTYGPNPYGMDQGGYQQGMPAGYAPPFRQPYPQPPYMNPYGQVGPEYGYDNQEDE